MTDPGLYKILLLGDTHIGLDFPLKPRVERRRRGCDFLANFRLALQPALNGQVDAVIHGGDLFDRSHIPDALVQIALEPLIEVAQAGIPVFLVPGNHERGKIPLQIWRSHAHLHIFDQPGSVLFEHNGWRICIAGFPFTRKIQGQFVRQIHNTGLLQTPADIRILCMHQTVEGAKVGPVDFTFRQGLDIIRGVDIPAGTAAVVSGHIHRCQVLRTDLSGRWLQTPVIYPGSVERTAFAEQNERKGYLILEFQPDDQNGGKLVNAHFHALPARPMVTLDIDVENVSTQVLSVYLQTKLADLDPESVVRLRLTGNMTEESWKVIGAASLRVLAPPTMNIELSGLGSRPNRKN